MMTAGGGSVTIDVLPAMPILLVTGLPLMRSLKSPGIHTTPITEQP